jgi:hypothetical protein
MELRDVTDNIDAPATRRTGRGRPTSWAHNTSPIRMATIMNLHPPISIMISAITYVRRSFIPFLFLVAFSLFSPGMNFYPVGWCTEDLKQKRRHYSGFGGEASLHLVGFEWWWVRLADEPHESARSVKWEQSNPRYHADIVSHYREPDLAKMAR